MKQQFYKERHSMWDNEIFDDSMKRIHKEALVETLKQCYPIYIIWIFIIIYSMFG